MLFDPSAELGKTSAKSPNSALFSEADTFQLLTGPPRPPRNRGAAPLSRTTWAELGAVPPQEGASERWITALPPPLPSARCSPDNCLLQISLSAPKTSTRYSFEMEIQRAKVCCPLCNPDCHLSVSPLSLKVRIKWIFLYHFTDKCFDKRVLSSHGDEYRMR